jgi:GcrA cell cycle regulator
VSTLHDRIRVVAGTRNEGPWAVEGRVDELKRLWAEGYSASQIAGRLGGGVSRNAVIAKVHRLGLAGRAHAIARTYIRGRARTKPKAKSANKRFNIGNPALRQLYLVPSAPVPFQELDIPIAERKTVETLTETSCRWPIGDPQKPDFHFCGRPKITGLSYCDHHARVAFQPPQPRMRAPAPQRIPTYSDAEKEDLACG